MLAIKIATFWVIFFIALNIVSDISNSYMAENGEPLFYTNKNISMLNETEPLKNNINNLQSDMIRPEAQLEGLITTIFGAFIYVVKAGQYLISMFFNATIGLPQFLNSNFDIPYTWATPFGILINLINFVGLIEFLTGRIISR